MSTDTIIPYVILLAHPDYKGSYTEQIYGCGTLDEIKFQVLKEINYYAYQNIVAWYGLENINTKVIEKLYNGYDIPYGMNEKSWTAKAFINGKWENINPTYEEIVEMIIKNLKKYNLKYYKECGVKLTNDYYYNSSDDDDNGEDDDDEDDDNGEDDDDNGEDDDTIWEDVSDNESDKKDYDNPSIYINPSEAKSLQNGPTNNIITPTNKINIMKK